MNFFRYNIVVAAYPVFVYVVSRAGRQWTAKIKKNNGILLGAHFIYLNSVTILT